jgi:hypothetical protein
MRHTKKAIMDGFLRLLGERAFDKISVVDIAVLEHTGGPITSYLRAGEDFAEVQREALQYELEGIQDMCEAKLIPHSVAKTLRDNVYLMQMDNEQRI